MSYTGLTNRLSQVYSEKQRQEYKKNVACLSSQEVLV